MIKKISPICEFEIEEEVSFHFANITKGKKRNVNQIHAINIDTSPLVFLKKYSSNESKQEMERFDSAFRIQSSYLSLTTIHYFLQHFRVFLLVYMIIYVDWIVSKLWLFDKRDNTLLTRLYLVDEKSGEKCVHVYETYNGKLVRRSQRESLNFLIQKFEEKYNKFDVQP